MRYRNFLFVIICLLICAFTASAYAGDEIEDLIDIAQTKSKLIAAIEGKKTITYNLRPKEKVLWRGSRGNIGAFLTDLNFYVISTSLNSWQMLPMRIDESGTAVASLSPFIALLVSKDRIVGFDSTTNRFIQARLPLHEKLVAAEIERYVAVVITSSRAFGFVVESSAFVETTLLMGEHLESIKMTFRKATVLTSDRLLSFEVSGATWNELRF